MVKVESGFSNLGKLAIGKFTFNRGYLVIM